MSVQAQTSSAALPQPPRIPTGQEIFDTIMEHFEPELTTEGWKDLDGKYAGETADHKEARRKRYEVAFERYEQAYEGYMATLRAQVQKFKRASFDHVEAKDRIRDATAMSGIQKRILKLA
jgi:hypothetical protein